MDQMTNDQALELADQLEQAAKLLLKTVERIRCTLEPPTFSPTVTHSPIITQTSRKWLP